MPLPRRTTILAIAIALLMGLEWQLAGSLGFYEDDFIKAWGAHKHRHESFLAIAADALLTDEPLFSLYHAARYRALGHEQPWRHHLLPGVLQVANAFLVYLLAVRLGAPPAVALWTEMMFAAFPGLGQALYWPSAIYVPLLSMILAGLHAWLSWLRTGAATVRRLALALYAAAIFTHEMAVGALAVFAAVALLESRDDSRKPWRAIGILAAINGAYLLIRQTHWFGLGGFTMADARPLSTASLAELGFASFNLNFGPWFWTRTEELAGLAQMPSDGWRAAGLALLFAAAGAWLCERRRFARWPAWLGLLGGAAVGLGLVALVGPAGFLRGLYAGLALGAVAGLMRAGERRREALMPWLLGLLWFSALFAPAWVYYVAFRHSYMAAPGVALLLAATVRALGPIRLPEHSAGFVAGLQWGVVCCLCGLFHWAASGEARAWSGYRGDVEAVRVAIQSARPPIAPGGEVVLVGFGGVRHGNPILTDAAVGQAVRLWLDECSVNAALGFQPARDGYRTAPDGPLAPYHRLRLWRFSKAGVAEAGGVELASGERIPLPFGDPGVVIQSASE